MIIAAVSRRMTSRHHRISAAFVAGLLVLLVTYGAMELVGSEWAATIQHEADITGSGNVAAVYQSALAFVAAILGVTAASVATTRLAATGWISIALLLSLLAILELTTTSLTTLSALAAPFAALPIGAFALHQTRYSRHLSKLVILMVMLIALSTALDRVEAHLTSNPDNYIYAGPGVPYTFTVDAWNQLRVVSHAQEISEIIAIICLIAVLESHVRWMRFQPREPDDVVSAVQPVERHSQ